MSSPSSNTSAAIETAPGPPSKWLGLRAGAWVQIGIVAMLFMALFWPNLRRLWLKTNPINGAEWADWSHTIIVPVIGLYYLWLRREELLAAPVQPLLVDRSSRARWLGGFIAVIGGLLAWQVFDIPAVRDALASLPAVGSINPAPYLSSIGFAVAGIGLLALALDWGLAALVGGMLLAAYGIWPGQNDYLKDMGMILTLFGVVLALTGWAVMRIVWFPIVYLVCAIPWPGLVYTKVAIPLQDLAARAAVVVLNIAQVDSQVEGTRIVIERASGAARVLNVAEACAGMRSLMTFIALGAALAFLAISRPLWQKLIIVASAVPIAILCNVMRVSSVGLLDAYVTEEASEGFAHAFVGLVMLVPALLLLLGVGWVLDQLFIEESDQASAQEPGDQAGAFASRGAQP